MVVGGYVNYPYSRGTVVIRYLLRESQLGCKVRRSNLEWLSSSGESLVAGRVHAPLGPIVLPDLYAIMRMILGVVDVEIRGFNV